MGGFLDKPITNKHLNCFGSKYLKGCAASMHGKRTTMEDAHLYSLHDKNSTNKISLFGVFDGHCGSKASEYLKDNLVKFLLTEELKSIKNEDYIKQQVLSLDKEFLDKKSLDDGSTCVFALVEKQNNDNDNKKPEENNKNQINNEDQKMKFNVTIGNVGDSRCVMGKKDGECIPLTDDHKPNNKEEKDRIMNAGGFVSMNRVNGNIALSRAIGDRPFKTNTSLEPTKQMIIALPDIKMREAEKGDFLLLACDGIYENKVFTDESLVQFVKEGLDKGKEPHIILGEVLDKAVQVSMDNMSIMLIVLGQNGENYQDDIFEPSQIVQSTLEYYKKDVERAGKTFQYALDTRKKFLEKQLEDLGKSTSSSVTNNPPDEDTETDDPDNSLKEQINQELDYIKNLINNLQNEDDSTIITNGTVQSSSDIETSETDKNSTEMEDDQKE